MDKACSMKMRNAYKVLVSKLPDGKRPFGRTRNVQEHIKMNIKQTGVRTSTSFMCVRTGSCERSNKPFDSIAGTHSITVVPKKH